MFGTERRPATGRRGAAWVLTPPPPAVPDAKVAPTPGGLGAACVLTSDASTVADTIACFSGGRLVALGVLTSISSAVRGAQQPLQRSFATPGVIARWAFVWPARPVCAAQLGTILLTFETPGVSAEFAPPVANT